MMPDCTTATCFTRKVCGHYAAGAVLSGEDVVVVVVVLLLSGESGKNGNTKPFDGTLQLNNASKRHCVEQR